MGDNLTAGDETGARAERLARIRRITASEPSWDFDGPQAFVDRKFLLAELDRVTAERDSVSDSFDDMEQQMFATKERAESAEKERDAAIASRNAWAEKAQEADREWERACVRAKEARAQAMEEAAKVAEDNGRDVPSVGGTYERGWVAAIQDAAMWIRALKEKP